MATTMSGMRALGHRKTVSYRPLPPSVPSFVSALSEDWTVLFCGCGGDSEAIRAAGATVKTASNHLKRAIETHEANFPAASHVLADISGVDPHTFPRTRFLWASPECFPAGTLILSERG